MRISRFKNCSHSLRTTPLLEMPRMIGRKTTECYIGATRHSNRQLLVARSKTPKSLSEFDKQLLGRGISGRTVAKYLAEIKNNLNLE